MLEREQYVKMLVAYHPQYGAGAAYAEEQIRQDIASHRAGAAGVQPGPAAYGGRRQSPPPTPLSPPSRGGATEQAERHLLRALVGGDESLMGLALEAVAPDEFASERARSLAHFLRGRYDGSEPLEAPAVLAALGDDPRADFLADLLMNGEEPLTEPLVLGAGLHLKGAAKERELVCLKKQIEAGTADRDAQRLFLQLQSELRGTPRSLPAREG